MTDLKRDYLDSFTRKAIAAGLSCKSPGSNWAALRDLIPGTHISLSVSANQVQVNLNNERDEDRSRFAMLYAARHEIREAVGEDLIWEQKDGRKKTAIRATLESGIAQTSHWDRQHAWAVETLKRFEAVFGPRLAATAS